MPTWNNNKTFGRIIFIKKVIQYLVFLPIIVSSEMTLRAGVPVFLVPFGVDICSLLHVHLNNPADLAMSYQMGREGGKGRGLISRTSFFYLVKEAA